ncbi:hypothetical protein ACVNIS_14870 [Sphaerotilaceae bacterium SBD11-9]
MQRIFSFLLRLVLLAMGLVFAASLLVAGVVFSLVLVVWSLLRGKRPRVVRFRVDPRSPFGGMRTEPRGEVVDIEAREVPDAPQQLKRDER